ncbi:MAG: transcription elongation factor GreA [Anaerolineaceae bacterium]|jgi:transcription elongation factor GreA|nr:transcription elongation factor GreA [Anaerolineaceae bacterium]MDD4042127.1 transcription elongation factor GreA [Anaerolineaceae bacterium]
MNQPLYLTPTGKSQLEQELAVLKGPRRDEISSRLKSAIEMGDLSENADYKAAKEDQGFLEGRIQEIEAILYRAEIIEESPISNDTVQIGNQVTIQEEGEREETWIIVGVNEADLKNHKISYLSPIGSALIDKKVGDIAEATLPNGSKINFRILKIE